MKSRLATTALSIVFALGFTTRTATPEPIAGVREVAAATPFPALRVTSAIEKRLRDTKALGVAVAVIQNGFVVYRRGFGVRDSVRRSPVDADTRFEIGSITKQFTAAAVLQLKEQGRLSLEDRLSKYVPAFPHANDVTLRQLLNQTSGLFEFMQTNHFMRMARLPGSVERVETLVRGPLHFVPGSQWEYSNTNYIALGRVVEVVSGESLESYTRRHLFVPAGMSRSSTIDHEPHLDDVAAGYWRGMKNDKPLSPAPTLRGSWAWAAGFIVSTVGDLAKWDQALESSKIITPDDFALMTTPPVLGNGKADDYGMGWWVDTMKGHKRFDHDGDTFGFSSSNWIFPKDDLKIILLENEPHDAAAGTAERVFDAIFPTS